MKKILLLILTLFLFISVYLIFLFTNKNDVKYLMIGDFIVNNIKFDYDVEFVANDDYRIIDLINIIKYNQIISNKNNIHQLLNKSDILIISIGMNDIYYKINSDVKGIYIHLNKMINDIENLFDMINKYSYKKIIFIGYYNVFDIHDSYFNYINNKIKGICKNNNIEFVDEREFFDNNFLLNNDNFLLNDDGYKQISNILVEKVKNC